MAAVAWQSRDRWPQLGKRGAPMAGQPSSTSKSFHCKSLPLPVSPRTPSPWPMVARPPSSRSHSGRKCRSRGHHSTTPVTEPMSQRLEFPTNSRLKGPNPAAPVTPQNEDEAQSTCVNQYPEIPLLGRGLTGEDITVQEPLLNSSARVVPELKPTARQNVVPRQDTEFRPPATGSNVPGWVQVEPL